MRSEEEIKCKLDKYKKLKEDKDDFMYDVLSKKYHYVVNVLSWVLEDEN